MKAWNRRKLVTASVAGLAGATFSRSEAQSGKAGAGKPFAVRAGEGRPGGQWTIHGERAFSTKVSGADVGKAYAALEIHTPPGHGPELHVHPGQNELFYLLRGSIGLQCGRDKTVLKTGDVFLVPADTPHAYVVLGAEPAHMLNVFNPAGEIEAFFADYAALVNVDGEPDRAKMAANYARHGMKVVGPPIKISDFSS